MQVLIDFKKTRLLESLFLKKELMVSKHSHIKFYELKAFFKFQIRKECAKIVKQISDIPSVELIFTDAVDEKTRNYFSGFNKTSLMQQIIENLDKIIKYLVDKNKSSSNIIVSIFSNIKDKNIFKIIDNIKDISNTVVIVTDDNNFFLQVKDYAYLKYKMDIIKKNSNEIQNYYISIILNTIEKDFAFKSIYAIDIYMKNNILNTKLLVDFYTQLPDELDKLSFKKAYLIKKKDDLINLKWKYVEMNAYY